VSGHFGSTPNAKLAQGVPERPQWGITAKEPLMRVTAALLATVLGGWSLPAAAQGECANPAAAWLFCEDFEKGGLGFSTWFLQSPFVECLGCATGNQENPNRILLTEDPDRVFEGNWALFMPAEAPDYQGASLVYRSCEGTKRTGCTLTNHEQLYFRAYVRLDPDHQRVHHFMSVSGSRPTKYWETDGNAGCRPNGYRAAGTTVDFNPRHELFFYTYSKDMRCDSGGYCSGSYAQSICDGCAAKEMPCTNGLECCWGNHTNPIPLMVLERGRWVCLEMMMKLNTPGQADGQMAFWMDGQLGVQRSDMYWRDVPELGLNKVFVQHYLEKGFASQSNRIAWDNLVASTEPIGCLQSPPPTDGGTPLPPDAGVIADAGVIPVLPGDGGAGGELDGGDDDPGVTNAAITGSCGCAGSASGLMALGALGLGALLGRRRRA
jgi:uncharacterized protein (TIGR03382 family)